MTALKDVHRDINSGPAQQGNQRNQPGGPLLPGRCNRLPIGAVSRSRRPEAPNRLRKFVSYQLPCKAQRLFQAGAVPSIDDLEYPNELGGND